MKAVSYSEHGGVEVLQTVDLPDPEPGPIDVVVAVEACALNRLDLVQRNGYYTLPGYTPPHIAGMDVAGTVVEVGADVTSVAVGDRVVVDPSLAGVADGSKLAGMGDLYGELGVIGARSPADTPSAASLLRATCTRCPTTCRSSTPRRSPPATSPQPMRCSRPVDCRPGRPC